MATGVVFEVRTRCTCMPASATTTPSGNGRIVPLGKLSFRGRALSPAKGGTQSNHGDYYSVSPYIPITGKPIRSEDGHVAVEEMFFNWSQIEAARAGSSDMAITFSWVVGASDMAPTRGAIVLHIDSLAEKSIKGDVIDNKRTFRAHCKPGVTRNLRYRGSGNLEIEDGPFDK